MNRNPPNDFILPKRYKIHWEENEWEERKSPGMSMLSKLQESVTKERNAALDKQQALTLLKAKLMAEKVAVTFASMKLEDTDAEPTLEPKADVAEAQTKTAARCACHIQ